MAFDKLVLLFSPHTFFSLFFPPPFVTLHHPSSQFGRYDSYLKEREKNFDLDFGVRAKLPEYNALLDTNMRNYFENRDLQNHLLKTGQV